jgi:hypothetical protein
MNNMFAALVPKKDTLASAKRLRNYIMYRFKKLRAIIDNSDFINKNAVFNNKIRIFIHTNKVNEMYWILTIEVYYCDIFTRCLCCINDHPCLNLHKAITTKFYKFCMMTLLHKKINEDIAHNILSFIDFNHLFIPLGRDRSARISPKLLINIMIVLSEQDVKNKALNAVMVELVPLRNSCSEYNNRYSSSNLRCGEMETWVLNARYLAKPIVLHVTPIHTCNYYNEDFDEDRISVWGSNNTTAIRAGPSSTHLKAKYNTQIHMYKKLHKIWHRYSFHLGLIYKLVRENRLVILQQGKLQLVRAKL